MFTTTVPSDIHAIDPLPITLVGGPDDGEETHVSRIYVLDGHRAVAGRAGEGYYHLPAGPGGQHPDTGRVLAVWEPHLDARVSWTREW